MPRYLLTIAYDGTLFHGWQHQQRTTGGIVAPIPPLTLRGGAKGAGRGEGSIPPPLQGGGTGVGETRGIERLSDTDPPPTPPLRTVQQTLQDAVRIVVREPIILTGASRTDSGVHALGQAAAFTTSTEIPLMKLPRAINSRLPEDVRVLKAALVPNDFNPIRDAQAKGYRYSIAHGEARGGGRVTPPFTRRRTAIVQPKLDAVAMNDAARRLLGEHDFTSFTRLHHERLTTVRTIHECKVSEPRQGRITIDIAGNGFLYNMVRIIAGTLVNVGRGRMKPDDIPAILAARDRRASGPTMPAKGLCLVWVRYPTLAQTPDQLHPPA